MRMALNLLEAFKDGIEETEEELRIVLEHTKGSIVSPEDLKRAGVKKKHEGDGAQISHPVSRYELWLSGNVDHAVIEYENVMDNRDRLLASGGSREDAFEIASGRLFLVEVKRQGLEQCLISYIPEAVSQAIVQLESAKYTYYESATRHPSRDVVENAALPLREIAQLVLERVSFSIGSLLYSSRTMSICLAET
ncbi:hypothetical protein BJY52DRAFT_1204909 [Lactarius psammicola]|nr:hypothetical protein BJY52DRAFT_1204909 [Lactarius psammicola]